MFRYFVAIPLPDDAKDRVVGVQPRDVPGMRRLRHGELHLTLHFLGEVDQGSLESLQSTLSSVEADAFTIDIRGVGTFPLDAEPQVMWAGVESCTELIALHHTVGAALTKAIGFRPEGRPYRPHVTLARFNTPISPGVLHRHLEANQSLAIKSIKINRLNLYSSHFVGNIPEYRRVAGFMLSAPRVSSADGPDCTG